MRTINQTPVWLVCISFVAGILLTIFPLPQWLVWWRPQWMLMILFFWVITAPTYYGVGVAWVVGLLTDMATGTPLGQHALPFVVLVYIALKTHVILSHSPRFQQAILVGFFALAFILLQSLILHFRGLPAHVWLWGLSVFPTIIFWPLVFSLLEKLRPRGIMG